MSLPPRVTLLNQTIQIDSILSEINKKRLFLFWGKIQGEKKACEGHQVSILSPIARHVLRRHIKTEKDGVYPWPFQIPLKFGEGRNVLDGWKFGKEVPS
jgi:hypothetical protein